MVPTTGKLLHQEKVRPSKIKQIKPIGYVDYTQWNEVCVKKQNKKTFRLTDGCIHTGMFVKNNIKIVHFSPAVWVIKHKMAEVVD